MNFQVIKGRCPPGHVGGLLISLRFRGRPLQQQQQQQKTQTYQANYNRNQDIQQIRLAIHAHSKRSAQGYIIDQFTNNNAAAAATGRGGGVGHIQLKSHITTQTQTHLHNNNNNNNGGVGNYGKEKRDKSVQANNQESTVNRATRNGGGSTLKGDGELKGRIFLGFF